MVDPRNYMVDPTLLALIRMRLRLVKFSDYILNGEQLNFHIKHTKKIATDIVDTPCSGFGVARFGFGRVYCTFIWWLVAIVRLLNLPDSPFQSFLCGLTVCT